MEGQLIIPATSLGHFCDQNPKKTLACVSGPKQSPVLPSGKRLHSELERSTIFNWVNPRTKWSFFNSYVKLPEGIS